MLRMLIAGSARWVGGQVGRRACLGSSDLCSGGRYVGIAALAELALESAKKIGSSAAQENSTVEKEG